MSAFIYEAVSAGGVKITLEVPECLIPELSSDNAKGTLEDFLRPPIDGFAGLIGSSLSAWSTNPTVGEAAFCGIRDGLDRAMKLNRVLLLTANPDGTLKQEVISLTKDRSGDRMFV